MKGTVFSDGEDAVAFSLLQRLVGIAAIAHRNKWMIIWSNILESIHMLSADHIILDMSKKSILLLALIVLALSRRNLKDANKEK